MNTTKIFTLGLALLSAAILYAFQGKPFMAEKPFQEREAEIASRASETLSAAEMLTLLQKAARERPEEAAPHYHMGVLLRAQGRPEDAARAFRSALRREPDSVPSLISLADLTVQRDGGQVSDLAAQLYERAWRSDNQQVRSGFMAGLHFFQTDRPALSEQVWTAVANSLEEMDPKREMLAAMIEAAIELPEEASPSPNIPE